MYCMITRIPPAGPSPADALDPTEAELRDRAPGVTANVSGPQEEYTQSPRASHAGTAMWAVLNLVCGLAVQPAPFALKPLLQDFSATAQSSAKSAAAEVPLRAAGGTVDGGLLRVERTGAVGANGAAAPRSEQDAAVTDQQLLNVTAPRDVHVGDTTTAAAVLTTTCCGPERSKSLVPITDASEPDYLTGEYPDDYGWDAAGLTADPSTFAAYREAALIHARRAVLGTLGSLTPELVAKCTGVQVDEPAWLEPDARVFPRGDLDHLADSTLLRAQAIPTVVACQVVLMGTPEAYCVHGGPLRKDLLLLHPGDAFDILALADDPDTVTELQLKEVKNGRLARTSMFGHYVRAIAIDEGPVASWTTHIALATLYVYLILADDPDTVTELQLKEVKNGRLARASVFGHYVQAIATSMQIDAPVRFKAGAQNFPEDGLDYINSSNLVRAQSSLTRATCQSVLMGAFKAYRINGGPLREELHLLHPAEAFNPVVLADDPDALAELKVTEVKNDHLDVFPKFGHYVQTSATDEGPEARKVQQDPATGPPHVPMGLANPGFPRNDSMVSLPLLPRNASQYNDSAPLRHVFVKAATGRTMTVRVNSWHDPVSTIEAHMHHKQGMLAGLHRLVFAGKTLAHSHWTLAQYGIGEGSTLEVLGRLRGGMPAKSDATNGDTAMTPAAPAANPTAANSSLLAWAKWVQGPYQALLKSAHFEQQLDEWELGFLEALTGQEVPEGAIAAMTTRAGLALDTGDATRAMAAYKGRRHLQPDFIAGVFRRVPHKPADEGTTTISSDPAPVQPHPTVLEWARWVAGLYAAIASRSTYAADLDKWEVDVEEYLMETEATAEQLATFVTTAGLDFDRMAAVRALGAYAARKSLRPDFNEFRFTGTPPADAPSTGGAATDQSRMREIVALLSAQKLEVEQMRQSLIPPLSPAAVDRFLTEALPYAWMTSLAAVLKELALEDTTGAWAKQALPAAVWRVLNEELRAKRQGRPSAPAITNHPGPQGQVAAMQPHMGATGSGTVCFNCGGRGHIARMCPWKAPGGQVQQMGAQTLWVSGNQAFDMNSPNPMQ